MYVKKTLKQANKSKSWITDEILKIMEEGRKCQEVSEK